uniref:Reverse transcriptase domain-containing protein n=1 Tax=Xenopus tropicalis TaxID=8364 RepID=A0A803J749_XENTR
MLASPVDTEEIEQLIKEAKSGKAPGPDGYTAKYYKKFAEHLIPHLKDLFQSFLDGSPPTTHMQTANIIMILKPGKDPHNCDSYRPISLITTDLKLFAKLMATRLNKVLPLLIHYDQVGFVPGRQAADNVRKAINLISLAAKMNATSLLLSLDAQKAFDRLNWKYMFAVLEKLRLPKPYITGLKQLYTTHTAQVTIMGTHSDRIVIQGGTRQGCPMSPLIFALSLEPLAHAIRQNPNIKGFQVGPTEHKISLFADDILLTLTSPQTTLPNLLTTLEKFQSIAGYKINPSKSHALPLQMPSSEIKLLQLNFDYKWEKETITYLGINLTSAYQTLYNANYPKLLDKLKKDLTIWHTYHLSWFGRIAAVKMTLLPRILYLFRTLPIKFPEHTATVLQKSITNFIWGGKKPRIKATIMTKPKSLGGLGVPHIYRYYLASRLEAMIITHKPTKEPWKIIENQATAPLKLAHLFWIPKPSRLTPSDLLPTSKHALDLWDTTAHKFKLSTTDTKLKTIFNNKDFTPGCTPANFKTWIAANLTTIKALAPEQKIISFQECTDKYEILNTQLFQYLQIKHYIEAKIKTQKNNPLTYLENICHRQSQPEHLISMLYYQLAKDTTPLQQKYMTKWEEDLGTTISEQTWSHIWTAAKKTSICATSSERAYKIIYRWYYTPTRISKLSNNPELASCFRGCGEQGSFMHTWWKCKIAQVFWHRVTTLLSEVLHTTVEPNPQLFLLGIKPRNTQPKQTCKLTTHILTAARSLLAANWKQPNIPDTPTLITKINWIKAMESIKDKLQDRSYEGELEWYPWVQYLESQQTGSVA